MSFYRRRVHGPLGKVLNLVATLSGLGFLISPTVAFFAAMVGFGGARFHDAFTNIWRQDELWKKIFQLQQENHELRMHHLLCAPDEDDGDDVLPIHN